MPKNLIHLISQTPRHRWHKLDPQPVVFPDDWQNEPTEGDKETFTCDIITRGFFAKAAFVHGKNPLLGQQAHFGKEDIPYIDWLFENSRFRGATKENYQLLQRCYHQGAKGNTSCFFNYRFDLQEHLIEDRILHFLLLCNPQNFTQNFLIGKQGKIQLQEVTVFTLKRLKNEENPLIQEININGVNPITDFFDHDVVVYSLITFDTTAPEKVAIQTFHTLPPVLLKVPPPLNLFHGVETVFYQFRNSFWDKGQVKKKRVPRAREFWRSLKELDNTQAAHHIADQLSGEIKHHSDTAFEWRLMAYLNLHLDLGIKKLSYKNRGKIGEFTDALRERYPLEPQADDRPRPRP